jgi:valine--pyruvate aminotransferase
MTTKCPEFSTFGRRFTRRTGALELMADLGEALSAPGRIQMLGGGNPARIPEAEAIYRAELAGIARDPEAFARMAGSYAPPEGDLDFRAAVAKHLGTRYGWQLSERNVALTAGSQTAFFLLFNLLAGHGPHGPRRILLPMMPEYVGYLDLGLDDDLFVAARPAIERQEPPFFKYRVDFGALRVTGDVAAICVSRPTNPTGNVLTDAEMRQLDSLARGHGIPLIVDAAYGPPFPGIEFVDATPIWNDNVILCLSLSKLGLPGLRTGIVVARQEIVEALAAMTAVLSLSPNNAGAALAGRLLASGELSALSTAVIRPYYESRMREAVACLGDSLAGTAFRIHRPEGAFFLWLWLEGLPMPSSQLYRRLKQRGVFVLSGHHFFPGAGAQWPHRDECLRLSYAQQPEVVSEGIRILGEEVRRAYAGGG